MIAKFAGVFSVLSSLLAMGSMIGLVFTFGYPKIIRKEPLIILDKLYQTRKSVPFIYYFFGLSGFFLVFVSVLIGKVGEMHGEAVFSDCGKICGVLYGVILFAGITRYTKLFPQISKWHFEKTITDQDAELLFQSFNLYIGETVTEHVAFVFLSAMIFCFSVSTLITGCIANWIGYAGIVTAVGLAVGNLEFLGLKKVFMINRIFSFLAGIWMLLLGVAFLF